MQQFDVKPAGENLTLSPRIAVGSGWRPHAKPFATYLVCQEGHPSFLIDLYPSAEEYVFRRKAAVWQNSVAIGFGHTIAFVHCLTHVVTAHSTEFCDFAYFSEFYLGDTYLLGVTGCGLMRFDAAAQLVWKVGDLGIDGVVLADVCDGLITGQGEWDPPGGWLPFQVDLETGVVRNQQRPWYETNDYTISVVRRQKDISDGDS